MVDKGKEYGLVLEGGGGKGSYQIGAIQALYEKGYSFDVVSGTSIGALNAALLTMGSLEEAKSLWLNIQHEFGPALNAQSDNIDEEVFTRLTYAFENPDKIKELADLKGVIADNPLYKILEHYVTDSNIKSMKQELYTCSVPATKC